MALRHDTTLPTQSSATFYETYKKVVWKVKINRVGRAMREEVYTGVCIEKTGIIMTTVFNDEVQGRTVTLFSPSEESVDAFVVHKDYGVGLALVKVRHPGPGEYDYVEFSPQSSFDAGQKLFAFVFPKNAPSPNLLEGDLSFQHHPNIGPNLSYFPNQRTFLNLYNLNKKVAHRNFGVKVGELDYTTSFLQIGRLGATTSYQGDENERDGNRTAFGLEEGRGAPVLDNIGRLVGLVAFQSDGFDFAIHVDHLRRFFATFVQRG